jgi:hypothetical protein
MAKPAPGPWCLLALSLLAACDSHNTVCNSANCTGCCDSANTCHEATSDLFCGSAAQACAVCATGEACLAGHCTVNAELVDAGSKTNSTDGGGPYQAYSRRLAAAFCETAVRCGAYDDVQVCVADWPYEGFAREGDLDITAGRARMNQANAEACVASTSRAACNDLGCLQVSNMYHDFGGVLEGTATAGQPCLECGVGLYCSDAVCPSTCAPRIGAGQPVTEDQRCIAGYTPLNGTCQPTPPRRLPGETEPCPNGSCSLGLSCQNGVCKRHGQLGAACEDRQDCKSDAFCSANHVCTARKTTGATCQDSQECQSYQCTGSLSAGTCVEKNSVSAGGACSSNSVQCRDGLQCVQSTCEVMPALGQSCRYQGAQCAMGSCSATSTAMSGLCLSLKPANSPCASRYECTDSLCVGGRCMTRVGAGLPCPFYSDTNVCADGLFCTATSVNPTGICAQKKQPGQPCTAGTRECQGECVGGICKYCFF